MVDFNDYDSRFRGFSNEELKKYPYIVDSLDLCLFHYFFCVMFPPYIVKDDGVVNYFDARRYFIHSYIYRHYFDGIDDSTLALRMKSIFENNGCKYDIENDCFSIVDEDIYWKSRMSGALIMWREKKQRNRIDEVEKEEVEEDIQDNDDLSQLKEETTYLYIMEQKNAKGAYKIGISKDLVIRETTLQSENPYIICLYYKKFTHRKIALNIEKMLHNELKDYRLRGEWFALTNKKLSEIVKREEFEKYIKEIC